MDIFVKNLKRIRRERKLTQKQLAAKAHISLNSLQRYEMGQRMPKLSTLQAIAEALEVEPTVLVGTAIKEIAYLTDLEEMISTLTQTNNDVPQEIVDKKDNVLISLDNMIRYHTSSMYQQRTKWAEMLYSAFELLNSKGQSKLLQYMNDLLSNPDNKAKSTE